MKELRFTIAAESDLVQIYAYSVERWQTARADHYLEELYGGCLSLRGLPLLGRECPGVQAGLRRVECAKHVIFYGIEAGTVIVKRVLHASMLPSAEHFLIDG